MFNTTNYLTVGTIDASGNSTSVRNYGTNDLGPFNFDCYYYRLKIIYFDSTADFSQVVSVCIIPDIKAFDKPYPNPFFDKTAIALDSINIDSEITIILYETSIRGKIVYKKVLESTGNNALLYLEINNFGLASGRYFLEIYNGESKIYYGWVIAL